ncbi:MAG: putative rane protein [Gemmatimonadetes bacterium]|nr:putative rane protein [Gemmatimonadota bacterium]
MVHEDELPVQQRLDRLEMLVEELLRRSPASAPAAASAIASEASPPIAFSASGSVAPDDAAATSIASAVSNASTDSAPLARDAAARVAADPADTEPPAPHRVPDGPRMGGGAAPQPRRAYADAVHDPSFAGIGNPDAPPRRPAEGPVRDGWYWLNRMGIVLVLAGMALLFKYSIDYGVLTPVVRVFVGLAVGIGMLGAGLWSDVKKQRFVWVLYGGGMAVFYIVGFAAYYLYELVGYAPAFVGLALVTVLTFAIALWKDEQALALLATFGGLGVPLVLGIDHGRPQAFAIYTCFILGLASALHLRRGWRGLHWMAMAGGWLLLVTYAAYLHEGSGDLVARWAMQGAALFAWLATAVLPVAQEVVRGPRDAGAGGKRSRRGWDDVDVLHWHGTALLPALLALLVASQVWSPTVHAWGAMTLGAAAVYAVAALLVRDRHEPMGTVLSLAASLLLATGTVASFDGRALLLILAGEGLAFQVMAGRTDSKALSAIGHALYASAAWWTLLRLVNPAAHGATEAAVNLAVVAAGFAMSFTLGDRQQVVIYRLAVHALFMAWIWSVLSPFSEGFVTVAWGAYALGMLVYAMRAGSTVMERTAVGTLLVVVAKLFLVDLARVEALWRVLLFMGMGLVFLFLSYALQSRFKARGGDAQPSRPGTA